MKNYQELIFANGIETKKSDIIKVNDDFLEELDHCSEMFIEGDADEQIIINTKNSSFKMKGVNISTTVLVLNSEGEIMKESNNYLEIERFQPPLHHIYQHIYNQSCHELKNFDENFLQNYGFTFESLKKETRLSKDQFSILVQSLGLIEFQGIYIYLTLPFKAQVARKLFNFMDPNSALTDWFTLGSFLQTMNFMNNKIFHSIAKQIQLDIEEGGQYRYRSTLSSILIFVVMEIAISKKKYNYQTFHEAMDNILAIYLPTGVKKPQNIPQISLYFIKTKNEYIFYDYLQIDPNIPSKMKFLASIKTRWPDQQLKAVVRGYPLLDKGKTISMHSFLQKKFRKYGDQYEIRMILPK